MKNSSHLFKKNNMKSIKEFSPKEDSNVAFKANQKFGSISIISHLFGIFKDGKFYAFCGGNIFQETPDVFEWEYINEKNLED
jgi:hypothetical protein